VSHSSFETFIAPEQAVPPSRRDFLYLATGSVAAVGAAAMVVPLADQMNPDASTLAATGPIDIDISKIQPGERIVALWAAKPVFIINRPQTVLDELRDPKHIARLLDPNSEARQQPAYAANWSRSIRPEFVVMVGICTHLGCVPLFEPRPDPVSPAPNWPGGFFCPCHASKYDLAGRVFRGVPAPYNLPIPPHHFPDEKTLRIGANPPGQDFDFGTILQV
jgi:ubiquinol-cytochrome c reductase iron-sulfur subunit